ncbi:MAG: SufS family cysteine desulfurase [Chlamydiota bacterium]
MPTQTTDAKNRASIRSRFPIFSNHPNLIYLDSAATTHKPQSVLDAMSTFAASSYATVHRALYTLSAQATARIEQVREQVQAFLGAAYLEEIVFTKGTTDGINLVRFCLQSRFAKGDEILITEGEHHANIVPWQLLADATGATLRIAPLLDDGTLDRRAFTQLLSSRTRLVAFAHVFNTTGIINPAKELVEEAKRAGALVLVDGAQGPSHLPVNMQDLEADFYVFSLHKMYGPTGLGILYGKKEVLESLPPYQGGGDMIQRVRFTGTTWQNPPLRFEAGTPPIIEIVGAGAALDFLNEYGMSKIRQQEELLQRYLDREITQIPDMHAWTGAERIGTLLFTSPKWHPMDLGMLLDARQIAIRTGRHCADPFHERFSLSASCRISLGIYTTIEDLDALLAALRSFLG